MTGKDLIVYILKHNLENEVMFSNGYFLGFLTAEELAAKLNVGSETIKIWYKLGHLDGFKIGDTLYFSRDTEDPRKETKCDDKLAD